MHTLIDSITFKYSSPVSIDELMNQWGMIMITCVVETVISRAVIICCWCWVWLIISFFFSFCSLWLKVLVGVVSHGPDGTLLESSYKNRDNAQYVQSLGRTIRSVAQVTLRLVDSTLALSYYKAPMILRNSNYMKLVKIFSRPSTVS